MEPESAAGSSTKPGEYHHDVNVDSRVLRLTSSRNLLLVVVSTNLPELAVIGCDMATEARACNNSASSPVFRLPSEVLAIIFVHCACGYHDHQQDSFPVAPSWVNLSYVCRHWRSVALDCPALWAYQFMVSPRWTKELLARSRHASLKIRAVIRHKSTWFMDEWMKHVDRIQELVLCLPDEYMDEFLDNLPKRAARLQILEISVWGPSSYHPPRPHRPFVPFDGDSPALRILELSHCPVVLSSLKLGGLTTLVLYHIPEQFRSAMEELLTILSCTQDLTRLDLRDALASAASFPSSVAINTLQRVNLPRLSRLSIAAPLSTVIAFLSWVNMPWDTGVGLECEHEIGSSVYDYSCLSSLFVQRLNMAEDQAVSSTTIRSFTADFLPSARKVTFSASELVMDSFRFKIEVRSSVGMEARDMDRFIGDICCSTLLKNVQSIRVDHPPFSSAFWRSMLEHLPSLRRIKLTQGRMPDLASMLSRTTHEGDGDGDGKALDGHARMLAPALEELELNRIIFLPRGARPASETAISQYSLLDALSTRDAPKGRLSMTQCSVLGPRSLPDMVRSWDGADIALPGLTRFLRDHKSWVSHQ